MILKSLKLTNFGVFQGEHTFALSPKASRPIVLFGGKNGAGKSTLFEAIRLCLYGTKTLTVASKSTYLAYLSNRLHTNSNLLIQPSFASVSLEFDFSDLGQIHTYEISRAWNRGNGTRSSESLELKRDGTVMDDIAADHWQDFIQDLIPDGISELFFFDGERIQQLADDSSDHATLDQAVKTLLGLDLVDRLDADLNIYLSRTSKSSEGAASAQRIEALDTEIRETSQRLNRLEQEHRESLDELDKSRTLVDVYEKRIASEGGTFARSRESLQKRRAELTAVINRDEGTIRTFAAELLPFALVPNLCAQLKKQLLDEEEAERIAIEAQKMAQARKEFIDFLQTDDIFGDGRGISRSAKEEIRERLLSATAKVLYIDEPTTDQLHELARSDRQRVLNWIDQATHQLPSQIRAIGDELERNSRALHKAERTLRKAPSDDTLTPLLDDLNKGHHRMQQASRRALDLEEKIQESRLLLRERERERQRELEKLAAAASKTRKLEIVPRIHSVLNDYRNELIERRLATLQKEATVCFNRLCRKKDTLRTIKISPKSFAVTLLDSKERPLKKSQLSAGEKQIYAVSMLWALARTSGRPLPMIIDTPLARLDSDHRKLLIQEYFPKASHQVIILSTDTEVDEHHFSQLQPHISHAYHLTFDEAEHSSTVSPGYFWRGST